MTNTIEIENLNISDLDIPTDETLQEVATACENIATSSESIATSCDNVASSCGDIAKDTTLQSTNTALGSLATDATLQATNTALGGLNTSLGGIIKDVTGQSIDVSVGNISTVLSDVATDTTLATVAKDTTLQATNTALAGLLADTTGQSIASAISGLGAILGNDKANIDGSNIANPSAFRSAIGISSIFTTKELLSVSNVPTTATSYNLIDSFNNYLLIMISILFYDNVREELTVTSNYFNNTSAGLRPTVSYQPINLTIDVYKNGNNAVYVKANTAQSNYKLVITGVCKIN